MPRSLPRAPKFEPAHPVLIPARQRATALTTRHASRAALLGLLVPLLGAAACAGGNEGPPSELRGVVLPKPLPKPELVLTDTRGAPFDLRERTRGTLTFLFFGYTNCADICPVQMANLARALKRLSYEQRQRVNVVFVTADPTRDTPERIRSWLDKFDPAFVGLRGALDTVNRVQASLGLPPAVREAAATVDTGKYDVGHSAQMLAFTADDSAHVTYTFGTREADFARDIPKLLRSGWNRAPAQATGAPAATRTDSVTTPARAAGAASAAGEDRAARAAHTLGAASAAAAAGAAAPESPSPAQAR